jgi:DNA-binding IclR family transcriptional regulator
VGSVKCLLLLIVVCVRRRLAFSEALRLSGLKRSTAWDCALSLEEKGMIEVKRVLTLAGPRTLLLCSEEGRKALDELKGLLGTL